MVKNSAWREKAPQPTAVVRPGSTGREFNGKFLQEGPEHTKAVMCRTKEYKYVRRFYELDELYDLINDPGETVNRIDDPGMAGVLAELKERLLTFYQETCDAVPHVTNKRG